MNSLNKPNWSYYFQSLKSKWLQCIWSGHNHRRTRRGSAAAPGLKNFRGNSVFRTSGSCSKFLNEKYIQRSEIFRATLFFRASASCSKFLNDKKYIFNTVKIFRATLFLRASASWSKFLNDKKLIFNTVKIFRAASVFQSKGKLLKNPECKKYIQYS